MLKNLTALNKGFGLCRLPVSKLPLGKVYKHPLQIYDVKPQLHTPLCSRFFSDNPFFEHPETESPETIFKPSKRLTFKDGQAELYYFRGEQVIRLAHIILYATLGLIVFYCGRKLYYLDQRAWYGMFWYAGLGLWSLNLIRFTGGSGSKLILKIALKQDGRSTTFTTLRYGLVPMTRTVANNNIAKPVDALNAIAQFSGFGFPLLVEEDLYIVPRSGEIIEEEVLPAVFNGFAIDTTENEDEILIES